MAGENENLQDLWNQQQDMIRVDSASVFRGYYKHAGGRAIPIAQKMEIGELFLEETYDCISAVEYNSEGAAHTPLLVDAEITTQIQQARLSMREKQEMRMQHLKSREAEKRKPKPKLRLGSSCERLYCAACAVVVTEFAKEVHRRYNDSSVKYVHELLDGFCKSDTILINHVEMVADVCLQFEKVPSSSLLYSMGETANLVFGLFQEPLGYKDALLVPFEEDPQLDVVDVRSLQSKCKKASYS